MPIPIRILVVEDSPDDAELEIMQLEQSGFALTGAGCKLKKISWLHSIHRTTSSWRITACRPLQGWTYWHLLQARASHPPDPHFGHHR